MSSLRGGRNRKFGRRMPVEGKHDLLPWLNFFLAILKRAYRELDRLPG